MIDSVICLSNRGSSSSSGNGNGSKSSGPEHSCLAGLPERVTRTLTEHMQNARVATTLVAFVEKCRCQQELRRWRSFKYRIVHPTHHIRIKRPLSSPVGGGSDHTNLLGREQDSDRNVVSRDPNRKPFALVTESIQKS